MSNAAAEVEVRIATEDSRVDVFLESIDTNLNELDQAPNQVDAFGELPKELTYDEAALIGMAAYARGRNLRKPVKGILKEWRLDTAGIRAERQALSLLGGFALIFGDTITAQSSVKALRASGTVRNNLEAKILSYKIGRHNPSPAGA